MKIPATLFLMILALSCNSNKEYKKAADAQEAGTLFIRASLDGDYDKAKFYILKDSENLYYLDKWKNNIYDKLSSKEKNEYEDASIRPVKIAAVNDSVADYIYTNSYKQKDTVVLKVVRVNNEWLVDFKQYLQGGKQ